MALNLPTSPVEDLSFEDVVAFCAEQRPESIRLEYKKQWSSKKPGHQIAKEVCAFANTQGGLLLLGVDEIEDRLPDPKPAGQNLGTNPRQQVIGACLSHIYPPITPEVSDFLPNPGDSERGFVVIRVNPSHEVPHTISDGKDVYVRVHDNSKPVRATIDQIDRMLEQRRTLISLQKTRVDRGIECLIRVMGGHARDAYFAVAVGPAMPQTPLMERRDCLKNPPRDKYASFRVSRSFSDGAYWFRLDGQDGRLVDIYGNVLVVISLKPLMRRFEAQKESLTVRGLQDLAARIQGEKLRAIPASAIVRPLLQALDSAAKVSKETESYGPIRVRLVARGVDTAPLVSETAFFRNVEYAVFNPAEVEIDLSIDSIGLDPEASDLAITATQRLLWAWGCTNARFPEEALEWAEWEEHGKDKCSCGGERPASRKECLGCRRRAAAKPRAQA